MAGIPPGSARRSGTYNVSLAKRVDGALTPIGGTQTFAVESLGLASLPEKDRAALLAFQKKAGELQRAMLGAAAAAGEMGRSLQAMKKALADTPKADPKLGEAIMAAEKRLQEEMRVLYGDRTVQARNETAPPSLMERLGAQLGSTSPITATVKRDYEIAAAGFRSLAGPDAHAHRSGHQKSWAMPSKPPAPPGRRAGDSPSGSGNEDRRRSVLGHGLGACPGCRAPG